MIWTICANLEEAPFQLLAIKIRFAFLAIEFLISLSNFAIECTNIGFD
jgi:hypothetical protein